MWSITRMKTQHVCLLPCSLKARVDRWVWVGAAWALSTVHTNQSKFLTSKNCKAKLVFQVCLELHSHILDIIFRKQITNYRIFSLLNIGCDNISWNFALNQRLTTFQNVKKIQNYPQFFARLYSRSHYSKSQIFVHKFNFDKTPTFSWVFHPKFFWQFFSWNQSCQQLKSPKPQHFHEFFNQFFLDNFSREIKVVNS